MRTAWWLGVAALAGAGCTNEADVGGIDGDSDVDTDTDSASDTASDTDTGTGTDTGSETESETAGPCERDYSEPVQTVLLNEVLFDGTDDQVELRNDGDVGQPLTRWVIATSPERVYPFPAGLTIPAHGFVVLHWTPLDDCDLDDEACGLGGFLNDLTVGGGDLLVLQGDDLDCEDAVVDYARWGDAEATEKDVGAIATGAGEWPEGDAVDMSTYTAGASIFHDATDENGRTHWYLTETPTIGDPNEW